MLLLTLFSLIFSCGQMRAQIPYESAQNLENAIPIIRSELENMLAQQLITAEDSQQLFIFFENGGSIQNSYQLQGLLQSDLPTIILNSEHFIVLPPRQHRVAHSNLSGQCDLVAKLPTLLHHQNKLLWQQDSSHLGPAFSFQQRCLFFYQNWRFGAQIAKDAGEPVWHQHPTKGFDFMSAYIAWESQQKSNFVQKWILGSYQIQWGQGLQLWSSRGLGKSIDLLHLARNPAGLKPYQGKDEQRFLQGLALTANLPNLELLFISSLKRIDFKALTDTLNEDINLTYTSGLHRTASEMAKRKNGLEQLIGIGIRRKRSLYQCGALILYQHLNVQSTIDSNLILNPKKALSFCSMGGYFQGTWRQLYGYAECVALCSQYNSLRQSIALNAAFIYYLNSKLELGLHFRAYGPSYQSFYSNPISNSSSGSNERACIFQLKWIAFNSLQIQLSNEYVQIPHALQISLLPMSFNETRLLWQLQKSKTQTYSCQLFLRDKTTSALQYRVAFTADFKIEKSEELRIVTQFSAFSAQSSSSKLMAFTWRHQKFSKPLRFEFIFGAYQVPPGSPLLFTYPYLVGFGAQNLRLNGVGTYRLAAFQYTTKDKWQFGILMSSTHLWTQQNSTQIQISIRLRKQF